MKKLMFALGTAAALVGMADIESVNTVGFDTKGCDKGKFYILGIPFEGCDGTSDINKLVSGFTPVDFDDEFVFFQTAPQIQVPNATTGGYDVYYYLRDGWYWDEEKQEDCQKTGWCDSNGVIAGDAAEGAELSGELQAGISAWVKDVGQAETFVAAGQVPEDDSIEITAPVKFTLRCNPFPVTFNLNDANKVVFSGLKGADFDDEFKFFETAPQIQVPNAATGGYDVYYYLNDGWYWDAEKQEDCQKAGWCDSNGVIAGDVDEGAELSGDVPVGQGFWTKGVGSEFKMTFKK